MMERLAVTVAAVLVACAMPERASSGAQTSQLPVALAASALPPEQRRAFFGQLHIHTQASYDAWAMGTKLTPAQAYAFARGETVRVPASQLQLQQGIASDGEVAAKRAWPLDFMAVTDHAENIGVMASLDTPGSAFASTALGQRLVKQPAYAQFARVAAELGVDAPLPPEWNNPQVVTDTWEMEQRAARDYNQPGVFTTFVAFEWTAMPGKKNLHRNVIFAGAEAPPPFGANQSTRPEDLWTYLESVRAHGEEVIAIPHNGNASGGLMYDWNDSDGRPIDEAYAQRRATNEPLTEIIQIKGQSETHPLISPNDEFANFEIYDHLLPSLTTKSDPNGSYIRQAYGRGLVIKSRIGVNPYKYGLVGGSDIHNGLDNSDESATAGGDIGGIDPRTMLPKGEVAKGMIGLVTPPTYWDLIEGTPLEKALKVKPRAEKTAEERLADQRSVVEMGSGGLTGVWSEENTRASIFAALKRKETFATSGTRIRVRMFGGWGFNAALLRRADWVKRAYTVGAPMGGDLPARSPTAGVPAFVVQAIKDPDGANLDRIQIVKVWLKGASYDEKIYDVALSDARKVNRVTGKAPVLPGTVDLKTGAVANSVGAAMLSTVWKDPQFDPATPAVYYARVLEIATPRWSTLLALRNGLPLTTLAPATIQERAWSSPIWYSAPVPSSAR
jgi:signal recognition particle subunit SEC65